MPNQDELMQQIQTAETILSKVLNDISGAIPANAPAGIILRIAAVSLPALIETIRGTVQAVNAHQDQARPAQPIASPQAPPTAV